MVKLTIQPMFNLKKYFAFALYLNYDNINTNYERHNMQELYPFALKIIKLTTLR